MERLKWKAVIIFAILAASGIGIVRNEESPTLPTVTVRGFLNFRTTVDNTVIVFTSASQTTPQPSKTVPQAKPNDSREGSEIQELTYTQSPEKNDVGLYKPKADLESENRANKNSISHISDNIVVPSPASVFSGRTEQPSPAPQPQYPTGLVTILGATRVDRDVTTVYETKVIGTYIDGKYAQILQSTSSIVGTTQQIVPKPPSTTKASVPTSISEIKETIATTTTTIKPSTSISSRVQQTQISAPPAIKISSTSFSTKVAVSTSSSTNPQTSTATLLQSSFTTSEQPVQQQTQTLESAYMKTTVLSDQTSVSRPPDDDNKVQTSQQPRRSSTTRYRFVQPRRETQTVRLNRFKVKLSLRQDTTDQYDSTTESDLLDDEEGLEEEPREEEDGEEEGMPATPQPPVDPSRVVYQRTTLTSHVTLHVGRRKSVRTLTITTTVQRILDSTEPIPETTHTIPVIGVSESAVVETPPLIISRTFTTTEKTWHTSLVPIFDGVETITHTITESFHILKIITAYKTLPPGDISLLNSEEMPEAASTIDSSISHTSLPSVTPSPTTALQTVETPLTPHSIPSNSSSAIMPSEYSNPLLSLGAALSQNPLAAVYLGLQQFNRHVTLYSTITKTSSYVTTDTIYSTRTIRYYDGRATKFRKISEPVSTKEITVTTTTTTLEPYLNTQAIQQQQQLQQLIGTQLPLAPPPQYSTVTSPYTTVTTATVYSSRVYTLIYNAISTKYRTVTSSTLHPTTVTLYSTKEIPISATISSYSAA